MRSFTTKTLSCVQVKFMFHQNSFIQNFLQFYNINHIVQSLYWDSSNVKLLTIITEQRQKLKGHQQSWVQEGENQKQTNKNVQHSISNGTQTDLSFIYIPTVILSYRHRYRYTVQFSIKLHLKGMGREGLMKATGASWEMQDLLIATGGLWDYYTYSAVQKLIEKLIL